MPVPMPFPAPVPIPVMAGGEGGGGYSGQPVQINLTVENIHVGGGGDAAGQALDMLEYSSRLL